jgi:hypothetical protein
MQKMTPTHVGWFWFCPVEARIDGDDHLDVQARWEWLEWLFSIAEWFEGMRIQLSQAMIPDYEPTFMFKLREISKADQH